MRLFRRDQLSILPGVKFDPQLRRAVSTAQEMAAHYRLVAILDVNFVGHYSAGGFVGI